MLTYIYNEVVCFIGIKFPYMHVLSCKGMIFRFESLSVANGVVVTLRQREGSNKKTLIVLFEVDNLVLDFNVHNFVTIIACCMSGVVTYFYLITRGRVFVRWGRM